MLTLLLVLAGLYATLVAAVYLGQSSLLYLPSRTLATTPAQIGLEYETLHISTGDGIRLHGWYLPTTRARGTLLFFHGNAGNISHRLDSLQIIHDLGLNVLLFDYRGYGESEGSPDEMGIYRDAEAAWDYLVTQQGESPRRIVLFGRSLGASVAAWLGARREPTALILESAFISVPELAADLYPWLPARWLARLHYPTRDYLAQARCPVLVAHSPRDEIIPYRHGEALYRAAAEPKRFLALEGDHNSGFLQTGVAYRETLKLFLDRHLPLNPH